MVDVLLQAKHVQRMDLRCPARAVAAHLDLDVRRHLAGKADVPVIPRKIRDRSGQFHCWRSRPLSFDSHRPLLGHCRPPLRLLGHCRPPLHCRRATSAVAPHCEHDRQRVGVIPCQHCAKDGRWMADGWPILGGWRQRQQRDVRRSQQMSTGKATAHCCKGMDNMTQT